MSFDVFSSGTIQQFGSHNPKVMDFLTQSFKLEALVSGLSEATNVNGPTGGKQRTHTREK